MITSYGSVSHTDQQTRCHLALHPAMIPPLRCTIGLAENGYGIVSTQFGEELSSPPILFFPLSLSLSLPILHWHPLLSISIFKDFEYKKHLATNLAKNYTQLAKSFVEDSHHHDVCVGPLYMHTSEHVLVTCSTHVMHMSNIILYHVHPTCIIHVYTVYTCTLWLCFSQAINLTVQLFTVPSLVSFSCVHTCTPIFSSLITNLGTW